MTWISANAGAGKTLLMASYLDARRLPCIWYRLDARDADTATFFYYLREAARQTEFPQAEALPLLTAEYIGSEAVFAQNFFAQLFVGAPRPYALVFDNYQDLPDDAQLHAILNTALQEIPPDVRVFILSRTVPPAGLARWQANQRMCVIDSPALCLDREETAGLLALRPELELDDDLIDFIHERAQGWAVGVVLLSEHPSRKNTLLENSGPGSEERVFDYFASELFEQAPEIVKSFLCYTALLGEFDISLVKRLTNITHIENIVRNLVRRNLFIHQKETIRNSYEYHQLLRDFLVAQAHKRLPAEEIKKFQIQAAQLLVEEGQIEEALKLLLSASAWDVAARLIVEHAEEYIDQGLSLGLIHWIECIPEDIRQTSPWLLYWFGVAHMSHNPQHARNIFESAYELFMLHSDTAGELLTCCGAIDAIVFEMSDFSLLDKWSDRLEQRLPGLPALDNPMVEMYVTIGMFLALMYRNPGHKELPKWVAKIEEFVLFGSNIKFRLYVGSQLFIYYTWWIGNLARADSLLTNLQPLLLAFKGMPVIKITWYLFTSCNSWMLAKTNDSIETANNGLRVADESGVHIWDFVIRAQAVFATLSSGQMDIAQAYLERMAESLDLHRYLDVAFFHHLYGWYWFLKGDIQQSYEHARLAVEYAERAGTLYFILHGRVEYCRNQYHRGEIAACLSGIGEAKKAARDIGANTVLYVASLLHAQVVLEQGNLQDCLTQLRAGLALGRTYGFLNHTWWLPTTMSRLYALALEHGIEKDYVEKLIRLRKLLPNDDYAIDDTWPWPLRIYTLGRFSLVKNDKSVMSSGKAQKRPLELLKAIIAFGGRNVSEAKLMDSLWPDSEGDMAKQNLKSTVHRLRKLLESQTIQWRKGKLTLDLRYCWVDVWAVERKLNALLQALPDNPARLEHELKGIDQLYHGSFLQGEDESYVLSLRERLRSKILRVFTLAAEQFFAQADYDQAIAVFRKGLDIEPLVERFYQGIMQCQQALGHPAEALSTYEHYRQVMQNRGLPPRQR
ncbi:HTH-type transcriptional regulator MalT [bacterium BMS3Bbin05]|nr:HTH-type transcriptional regulator MalT [bacterium BMS3Bbin05]